MTKRNVLPSNTKPGTRYGLTQPTFIFLNQRKNSQTSERVPLIIDKKGASAYTLKLLTHWHIHPTFNEVLLTPYIPPAFPSQEQPPPLPPDLIDNEEHYEIKKVLDSRLCNVRGQKGQPRQTKTDYFIKWKGYGPESNSWV